jgi:peptidoglycan/LPS O-acetylase OafA/YrhL
MTTIPWRLGGIEALRGLAAISVIFYHVSRHVNQAFGTPGLVAAFQAGHAGVELFFVISGFIILFVHGQDSGRPRRLGHYISAA